LIELKSIDKVYKKGGFFSRQEFRVLKDVSIKINDGEHIGIVGSSGAGKTTLAKVLSFLEPYSNGSIYVDSVRVNKKNIIKYRSRVGMVFQDPLTSLDPRMKIISTLKEALKEKDIDAIYKYCDIVNIKQSLLARYPKELSGGEQQRVAIARALISNPQYIIFDEATSALDVSTQSKILNLICDINKDKAYSYIFITHDLKLASFISDRIYVIYGGYIVEETKNIHKEQLHPYTKMLVNNEEIVQLDDNKNKNGCVFYNFCKQRKKICKTAMPYIKRISYAESVRCFLYD